MAGICAGDVCCVIAAALELQQHRRRQSFESGTASEDALYNGFRELYEDSSANERYFNAWVDAFPNSYAAHLARGTYHYRMAWFIRGEKYIAATPEKQVQGMTEYLDQAQPELLASMKLTAKPYLSALYLLNVTLMDGSQDENRHWYEESVRIDPTNTRAQVRYMSSLRPRWGGSYEDMNEFLEECKKQNPNPALLAKRNNEDGWSLEKIAWVPIQQHRDAEALPALRKAAALNQPWSQFVLDKTLYQGCPELNIPADQKAGLAWIERSAHLCHREAVEFLTARGLPGGCDSLASSSDALIGRLSNWWFSGMGQGVGGAAVIALLVVMIRSRRKPPKAD